jgi:hypothetical protein
MRTMAVLQRRHGRRLQSAVPFRFAVLAVGSNRTTVGWSAHEQMIGAHS